jgi:hypothetical protein
MRNSYRVMLLLMSSACAAHRGAVHADDVEPSATVWNGSGHSGQHHVCAERPLSEKGLSGHQRPGPVGPDKPVAARDEAAKNAAGAANVAQISQFGQVALYRLCEAAGNGLLTEETYVSAYTKTLTSVRDLLEAQRRSEQYAFHSRLLQLRERIDAIDQRSCELRLGRGDGTLDDDASWETFEVERRELSREFDALRASTNAYYIETPRNYAVPTRRQVDEFEKDAAAYLSLDVRAPAASAACENLRTTFGSFWRGVCYATSDDHEPGGERTALRVIGRGCAL